MNFFNAADATSVFGIAFGNEWLARKWSEYMFNLPETNKSALLFEFVPFVIAAFVCVSTTEKRKNIPYMVTKLHLAKLTKEN